MFDTILESDRCIFSEWVIEDAIHLFELNSNPEVLRFTGDQAFKNIEDAQDFILSYDAFQNFKMGRWAIRTKSKKEYLGWCGLKYHPNGVVDLGFRFFQKYWNKGYATECSLTCLDYGFSVLQLEKIIARAQKENIASLRVIEKLGMKFEFNYHENENEWTQFSLIKSQWNLLPHHLNML